MQIMVESRKGIKTGWKSLDRFLSVYWGFLQRSLFCMKLLQVKIIFNIQPSTKGEANSGGLYLDAKRQNIYPPLPTSKHRQANFVAFLIFVCTTASFSAQISSSENVLKRDAILAPIAKCTCIPSYGSQ